MIHQRDEWRLAVGLLVRQREIIAKGAIDEFGAGVGVEQHDADVDLIERRRQTLRGGVMPAFPREGIHPSFPQQPGDGGGAGSSQRQHQQAHQIRGVVAGRDAVIEEEQRGASNRDGGGAHARGQPAERGCKSDDANEQRRGIGNGNKMTIDKNGDQSRRCRQGRTVECAPVELHACSRSPTRVRLAA